MLVGLKIWVVSALLRDARDLGIEWDFCSKLPLLAGFVSEAEA